MKGSVMPLMLDGSKFLYQMFDTSKTDFIQMDSIWMDHKFCTSSNFTFSTFIKPFHVLKATDKSLIEPCPSSSGKWI